MMQKFVVDTDGQQIAYDKRGSGFPLVLIHAGYLDSRMWDNQITAFESRYTTIRYDVRGFGQSSRPSRSYSDAEDLRALLAHLQIDRAIILGVSNGGRIALDFAVEFPSQIAALVLVDFGIRGYESSGPEEDALWKPFEEVEGRYNSLFKQGKKREIAAVDVDLWTSKVSPQMRERLLDIAEQNVPNAPDERSKFQASPDPPAFGRLNAITAPVLMLVGEHDLPGEFPLVRRVHKRIPGSELVTIAGADHIPSLSRPEEFAGVVLDFLERHSASF